ncbi:HNH endonuclease [Actinomadura sp. DLS-62]|uniref:HNH endonuclease n=1 Tax=Actinomadura monticuli TaxID=3097367 RepID=A0ABV4Q7J9_9ACTN
MLITGDWMSPGRGPAIPMRTARAAPRSAPADRSYAAHMGTSASSRSCTTTSALPPVRWWAFGEPDDVNNGLCLCALHHRLFDKGALGITGDRRVTVLAHTSGVARPYATRRTPWPDVPKVRRGRPSATWTAGTSPGMPASSSAPAWPA